MALAVCLLKGTIINNMNRIKNSFCKKEIAYDFVFITSIAVVMYALFTIGQAYVHADSSIATRYVRSMLEQRTLFPEGWYFVNNEIYVFNLAPISMITGVLINNQSVARVLASAIGITLAMTGVIYMTKKVFKCNAWKLIFPLIILLNAGANSRDMVLYQAAYMPQLVALTFVAALYVLIFIKTRDSGMLRTKMYWGYAVLVFSMGVSGIRYLAELVLPLIGAIGLFFLLDVIKKRQKLKNALVVFIKNVLLIGVPFGVGYAAFKYILSHHRVATKTSSNGHFMTVATSFEKFISNIEDSIASLESNFGVYDKNIFWYIGLIFIVSIFFVVPIVQLINLKKENEEARIYILFCILHNLEFLIIAIILGINNSRYLLSSFFISCIILGIYIWEKIIQKSLAGNIIISILMAVIGLLGVSSLLKESDGWSEKLVSQKNAASILVDKGLTKGYGTYWNAYALQTYSDNAILTGAVTFEGNNVTQYLWLNDKNVFNDSGENTFLIIASDEMDTANLSLLGPPIDEFEINDVYEYNVYKDIYEGKDFRVYVYPYDIGLLFADSYSDGYLTAKDMFFNDKVVLTDGQIQIYSDGLICGPYSIIDDGEYEITYVGEGLDLCEYDIYSELTQDNIKYEEVYRDDKKMVVNLTITESVEDIQFRVFNNQNTDKPVVLHYISVFGV